MDQTLVERWNDTVHHKDTVYILGDLALGKLDDSLAVVNMMHGCKVLVVGNHDRPFAAKSPGKRESVKKRYIEDAGLAGIIDGSTSITIGGVPITMSHFPYRDEGDDRYIEHRPVDHGGWLLHGHVHERWKVRKEDRMINCGVDVWGFAPVHEDVLTGIIGGAG